METVVALQVTPGPDMLLVVGRGVGQGRRAALLTAAGATFGAGVIQLPLLAFGLASLMEAQPVLFDLLRWLGAAYLLWLGAGLLLKRGGLAGLVVSGGITPWDAMRGGMVSNLTNPKVLVFMLAFLPQFMDADSARSAPAQILTLGAVQKLSGFTILSGVALGAGGLGDWLSRCPRVIVWQRRLTGAVLVGLGIRLLLSGDFRALRT